MSNANKYNKWNDYNGRGRWQYRGKGGYRGRGRGYWKKNNYGNIGTTNHKSTAYLFKAVTESITAILSTSSNQMKQPLTDDSESSGDEF